jgi:hypothetical protein
MQKHTKIYLEFFGYDVSDFICCEICDAPAGDTHHIIARGMGGSRTRDFIENLMTLCRACHEEYGDKEEFLEYLTLIHYKRMNDAFKDLSHLTIEGLHDCKIALEANIADCKRDKKIRLHEPQFHKRLQAVEKELSKRTQQSGS